jgi:hypothetical protein
MKQIFKSRYTDKPITVAQHLAELMCERMAQKDKSELPYRFWNTTKWKKPFLHQLQIANSLLKLYKAEAILLVLRKNKNVYSLNAQFLDNQYRAEDERLEHQAERTTEEVTLPTNVSTTSKPREEFVEKESVLSKLRKLDG